MPFTARPWVFNWEVYYLSELRFVIIDFSLADQTALFSSFPDARSQALFSRKRIQMYSTFVCPFFQVHNKVITLARWY